MSAANVMPRMIEEVDETVTPLSPTRYIQAVEQMQDYQYNLIGRGILSGGLVTATSGYGVELEAGTVVVDSGAYYETPAILPYTATVISGHPYLWGRLKRTPADQTDPFAEDIYSFELTHTTTSSPPVVPGVDSDDWIPMGNWPTDGSGVSGAIAEPASGKYIISLASSLGTIADDHAEIVTARGSMPTLDERLDVALNEDGSLKESAVALISWRQPARAVAIANVNLAIPGTTFDGVVFNGADDPIKRRLLLTGQTASEENGLYLWTGGASALTRVTDADTDDEVIGGLTVVVNEGTVYHDTVWLLDTNDLITVDTTGLEFIMIAAPRKVDTFTLPIGGVIGDTLQYRINFAVRGSYGTDYFVRVAVTQAGGAVEGVRCAVLDSNRTDSSFDIQIELAIDVASSYYDIGAGDLDFEFTLEGHLWQDGADPISGVPTATLDPYDWSGGGIGGGGSALNPGVEEITVTGTVLNGSVGSHRVVTVGSAGDVEVIMPPSPVDGDRHTIIKIGSGTPLSDDVKISANTGQAMDFLGSTFIMLEKDLGENITYEWKDSTGRWLAVAYVDQALVP